MILISKSNKDRDIPQTIEISFGWNVTKCSYGIGRDVIGLMFVYAGPSTAY